MRVSAARGGEPYWPAAPVFLMLASVGIWAVAPLVIALSGASRFPFLFAASMEAGAIASYLLFLLAFYRDLLADRSVLLVLGRHLLRRGRELAWLLLGILSGLSYALFAWSTRFVDVSVSAVFFDGLWPFVLVMMFFLLYRGAGRTVPSLPRWGCCSSWGWRAAFWWCPARVLTWIGPFSPHSWALVWFFSAP